MSSVVLSFYKTKGYAADEFIRFGNYKDVLTDSLFRQTFENTVLYVLFSFLIGFLIPITIAIMVNEMRRGRSFFKLAVYFPSMVPGVAVALMWLFMFNPGKGSC